MIKYCYKIDVTCNCLHPGVVDSGVWRNVPFLLKLPLKLFIKTMFKVGINYSMDYIHFILI